MSTREIDTVLGSTRSVRKRRDLDRPVPRDLIQECPALAQQAPTGGDRQLSSLVVVTDPALRAGLAEIYRRAWQRDTSEGLVEPPRPPSAEPRSRARPWPIAALGAIPGRQPRARPGAGDPGDPPSHGGSGERRDGLAVRIGPARHVEVHAGLARSGTRHRLDDAAPVLRARCGGLLGIPYEETAQGALIPVAFTIGDEFKPGGCRRRRSCAGTPGRTGRSGGASNAVRCRQALPRARRG